MKQRLILWERYGTTDEMLAPLADVAQRLLRVHVTFAATERDWSLWGRVYNASRSQLAQERAKKLFAICRRSQRSCQLSKSFRSRCKWWRVRLNDVILIQCNRLRE
jgi:hypothetical protein